MSWGALAAALLGVMLARWTWLLLAPAGAALPPSAWEATEDAGRVFGTAVAPVGGATAAPANIKLIGVFANRTKGFAIMQVDDKQLGVAQGDDVRPGLRLVETHADYVVLERGGALEHVDLTGAPPAPSPSGPSVVASPPGIAPQFNAPPTPDQMAMLRRERQRMGAGR